MVVDQLAPGFPIDAQTGEPQLLQLPYREDPWLFLAACTHLIRVSRTKGEPAFRQFEERWPSPRSLLASPCFGAELRLHFRQLGLFGMRSELLIRAAYRQTGRRELGPVPAEDEYLYWPGYPREAWRVLALGQLAEPAQDRVVEAWRRWTVEP